MNVFDCREFDDDGGGGGGGGGSKYSGKLSFWYILFIHQTPVFPVSTSISVRLHFALWFSVLFD